MSAFAIVVDSFFDGEKLHDAGQFTLEISAGKIVKIHRGNVADTLRRQYPLADFHALRAPFAMPGLVEAHAHLFLNGGELDSETRRAYLEAPFDRMLAMGWRGFEENLAAGVTLIRDGGDFYGVNAQLKCELPARPGLKAELRSPGRAIRRKGRYGSFLASEVTDKESLLQAIRDRAPKADDLKILLTGIIDFETGRMKGSLQFDADEARLIVRTAHEIGIKTFAHCSGMDGLQVAAEAGIDSIEHGFFMTREILEVMADKNLAWVPTFSPVYFQFARPDVAGWSDETVQKLDDILQNHFEHVAMASEMGVPVIPGSDSGSFGVPHGTGLIDELFFHRRAGISVINILKSATSLPRRLWNCESANLESGNRANLILLAGSPFDNFENIRSIKGVMRDEFYEPITSPEVLLTA